MRIFKRAFSGFSFFMVSMLTMVTFSACKAPESKTISDSDIGIWYSTWYAKTAGTSTDNKVNTWSAWNIAYKPLMPDGSFNTYDALSEEVLLYHLKEMSDAQIDFIIMDQTNNIDVDGGYINKRSLKMAQTVKKFNDNTSNRKVKYCSAVGGIQWKGNPASIENEAKILWDRYCNTEFGGEDYHYYVDNKPVMVVYLGNINVSLWENYTGSKEYANKFSIRFANNASQAGYWGWAYNKGTKLHWETVVVMPGWNNMKGATPVNRNVGKWYNNSWNVLLKAKTKPRIVVINSFNEYAEGTAVFPADTSGFPEKFENEKWKDSTGKLDPYLYWNLTKEYIKQYKALKNPLTKPYTE